MQIPFYSSSLLGYLFSISQRYEPVDTYALITNTSVERFDKRVIDGLSTPREVKHDPALAGPEERTGIRMLDFQQ
jgi:hypothetical protein